MNNDYQHVQRFLALSELYFQLTSVKPGQQSTLEFQELLEFINDDTPPQMSPGQYMC